MKTGIVPQFRMKRDCDMPAAFNSNNTLIELCEDLQCRAGPCYNRGTDKDSMERSSLKTGDGEIHFKRLSLPAERIPVHKIGRAHV